MNNITYDPKLIKAIEALKKAIHDRGLRRDAIGAFDNGLFSETKLIAAIKKAAEGTTTTVTSIPGAATPMELAGKLVVLATMDFVISDGETQQTITMTCPGSDRNDISMAHGKALTYMKRYFYSKLLDLGGADLEPDNPDVIKKELRQYLNEKIAEGSERTLKFLQLYKDKYNQTFNPANLSLNGLKAYADKI